MRFGNVMRQERSQNLSRRLTMACVTLGCVSALGVLSACKEPIEPRRAPPTPAPSVSPNANAMGSTDPRCAQPDAFVCQVAADLVTLCREKEPTNTSCGELVWTKSQWDRIVALQKSGDSTLTPCPSENWFVNTQTDPLLVRDKPSISGTILSDADRGSAVTCLGISVTKDEGEWMKAKTDAGQEGFMKKEFLNTTAPATASSSAGSGTGSPAPAKPKTTAGAKGICVKNEYSKVGQAKPSGKSCSNLDGTPHKGSFGNPWPNETLISCFEQRTGLPNGWDGFATWSCLCQVKKVVKTFVPPNTACPPGYKPE